MAERIEKEREQVKERISHHTMSRTSSHSASHRGESRTGHNAPIPTSPKAEQKAVGVAANVRASFSFAHAAAGKKDAETENTETKQDTVEELTEQVGEVQI